MAIILNIDTSVDTASICLATDGQSMQLSKNEHRSDHASWLHPAISKMIVEAGLTINKLEAVAVCIGPGSYTGLRVGLSAAKGLCYSLGLPLIALNTLEMMAYATRDDDKTLLCPMIDARRTEVFTAVYDKNLTQIMKPNAMLLSGDSFKELLRLNRIIFSGNGVKKARELINHTNGLFSEKVATAENMIDLTEQKFRETVFADVAYIEPFYLKEFYSATH